MRARSLKPGFFKNEVLAELPPLTRILFAGLWCMADREGRLEDRPKRIKAEVLPYDDCDVDEMLDSLCGEFIQRYTVEGERYIQILNFLRHQQPHYKEAPSLIPPAPGWQDSQYPGGAVPPATRAAVMQRDGGRCRECGSTEDLTIDHVVPQSRGGTHEEANLQVLCRRCNSAKNNREAAANVGSTSAQGRAELGANKSHHDTLTPDSPYPDSKDIRRARLDDDAEQVFAYWQERLDHRDAKLTPDRRAKIVARLREGASVERLKEAIDGCAGSKYHMGDNDQGRRYDSIGLIFRNADKVDEFVQMARQQRNRGSPSPAYVPFVPPPDLTPEEREEAARAASEAAAKVRALAAGIGKGLP